MEQFDINMLLAFNGSDSLLWDSIVSMLTNGIAWLPLYVALLYLVIRNNETMGQILLIVFSAMLCLLLSGGVDTLLIKPLVGRIRPCYDPQLFGQIATVGPLKDGLYSFFSSHAANTFSLAVFFSLLVRSRLFTATMVIWSLFCCYTRLYLGMHYPSDIMAGLLWGAVVGVVVYIAFLYVYNRISPAIEYVSTQYTSTGYSFVDVDVVVAFALLPVLASIVCSLFVLYQ